MADFDALTHLKFIDWLFNVKVDCWPESGECDPNPSDAFDQGASRMVMALINELRKNG